MIFVSVNDMVVTLPPSSLCLPAGWPAFSIATFNVPANSKAALKWRHLYTCQDASDAERSKCQENLRYAKYLWIMHKRAHYLPPEKRPTNACARQPLAPGMQTKR